MILRKNIRLAVLIFIAINLFTCEPQRPKLHLSNLKAIHATSSEREKFKKDLIETTIFKNLASDLTAENEAQWQGAFWGMELAFYRSDSILIILKNAFNNFFERSPSFQRAFIEAIYGLYSTEFAQEMKRVAEATDHPKLFAMAIHYLCRIDENEKPVYLKLLQQKFSDWQIHPILYLLSLDLQTNAIEKFKNRPALFDILTHPFEKGKVIIYCLQRNDRDYPGLTIIKKPDGKFMRSADGAIFSIPHLARSASNLPGYITNGNTPQGIFSIQGSEVSKNVFIGATPNLQLVMPFEVAPGKYFHQPNMHDTTWSKKYYENLLPERWRNYQPMYEAFYAGKAERTEIIAHGTTIDPEFYRGLPFYPNTPSLGCLTAKEIWSGIDGTCLVSDQLALMKAFFSVGVEDGYFVIIEIDDKKQPVALDEIIMELLQAEDKEKQVMSLLIPSLRAMESVFR